MADDEPTPNILAPVAGTTTAVAEVHAAAGMMARGLNIKIKGLTGTGPKIVTNAGTVQNARPRDVIPGDAIREITKRDMTTRVRAGQVVNTRTDRTRIEEVRTGGIVAARQVVGVMIDRLNP